MSRKSKIIFTTSCRNSDHGTLSSYRGLNSMAAILFKKNHYLTKLLHVLTEVMTTLDRATLESGDQKEIANKVLEVLQGDNLQVVYSGKSGNESRIGFTQF